MEPKISLCLIVRNEAKNLRRCLSSVSGAVDEIIVVDTGSVDETCHIAREFGATVQSYLWNNNFSDARNVSLELASGDWILFLDADEALCGGSAATLRRLVVDETVDGYFIKIINYLGSESDPEWVPDLVFRLFRNRPEYRFRGAIHEQIVDVILEKNNTAKYQIADSLEILHYGYMNEQIEEKDKKQRNLQLIRREVAAAPDNKLLRYHYGVELYRAGQYDQAAEELITAASGLDPQTIYLPKLLRYIVLSYHAAGKQQQALTMIELALRFFPDYADLYYYRGIINYDCKEYGLAYAAFQQAADMPEQPPYYAPFSGTRGYRAYYYLGQVAEKFDNKEEALRHYIQSLRDNACFTAALEAITCLLEPRDHPEYAEDALGKICEFCTPRANIIMGQILFRHNAFRLALRYLAKGMPQEAVLSEISLWKAVCLLQERRNFEALRILEGFGEEHSLYPVAKLNKLLGFWLEGNCQKARLIADELFSLGLSEQTGAVIALLRGTLTEEEMVDTFLADEGAALVWDIITRLLDLEEWEKAEALLSRLSSEWVCNNLLTLGRLYSIFGNDALAAGYLELGTQYDACAEGYDLLAKIRLRRGGYLEACELYRKAIALEPQEPAYYLRLIAIYDKLRERALEHGGKQRRDGSLATGKSKEGLRQDESND
jgi:glycosyltransferase involved in cell wall biosynthesis